jgi:hypothetical protein
LLVEGKRRVESIGDSHRPFRTVGAEDVGENHFWVDEAWVKRSDLPS